METVISEVIEIAYLETLTDYLAWNAASANNDGCFNCWRKAKAEFN